MKVFDKFSGEELADIPLASPAEIEKAIAAALLAAPAMAAMPAHERREVLQHCVRRFSERAEELASLVTRESGKTLKEARAEVARLIETFEIAAEETLRIGGEVMPLDRSPRCQGYTSFSRRVPLGPLSLITPFNFPLNLVAHKVAPAIAAGCPFVLKPADLTPLSALLIRDILAETRLPAGAFAILPMAVADAAPLIEDERFKMLSFTGSAAVGWELKRRAGKKRVCLELGGNAAVIIDADADLPAVLPRLLLGAYFQAGQSCVSVQRICVHRSRLDELRAMLIPAVSALVCGDPRDPASDLGPMISDKEAQRLESWIAEALAAGARLLCGGTRRGSLMPATLLEGVPESCSLSGQEAFGPVAFLEAFDDFDELLPRLNRSRYGLQAGLFCRDLGKVFKAWKTLEVGALIVGDIPSWRSDAMPYGGVKDSGTGREGLRAAIFEMTEERLMVIRE
ncbi:MAG: hypothetical protein RL095_2579 [Verrucomicrobiota bacterium]|jgi:acyl-CoA reductase-like NAD-dependent aldehyde dehydrogenase